MIRALARGGLTLALAGSLGLTAVNSTRIAADPALSPLRAAAAAEIAAATDRMMTDAATPDRLAALIAARLAEDPRNWVALDALMEVVAERDVTLPADLLAQVDATREADSSAVTYAVNCAACAYDPEGCALSLVMVCYAPIVMTPLGDIAGITRAGMDLATGAEVDQIDLALSIVGLAATALVIATGGSSVLVKAGAGLARVAHKTRRLSSGLSGIVTDALRSGVDLAALPRVRSVDDLARVIKPRAFAPVMDVVTDLARLRDASGTSAALHLLPLVDNATDARRLGDAAQALGPRLVGRAEVLGKARLMRATLRLSETAWQLLAGLAGLLLSVGMALGGMVQGAALRALRRTAGPSRNRFN